MASISWCASVNQNCSIADNAFIVNKLEIETDIITSPSALACVLSCFLFFLSSIYICYLSVYLLIYLSVYLSVCVHGCARPHVSVFVLVRLSFRPCATPLPDATRSGASDACGRRVCEEHGE